MTRFSWFGFAAAAIGSASAAAAAQMSAPPIISALPDVSSMSPANAAGVLQYCLRNNLVSSAATEPVLSPLTRNKGVSSSPDYAAGLEGRILTPNKSFSIGRASSNLKSQACDMVFRRAKKFR